MHGVSWMRSSRSDKLKAKGVYGFFAAASVGDDVELYVDPSRKTVLTTIHHLRQQSEKSAGQPNLSLADYVAPKESGRRIMLGVRGYGRVSGWMTYASGLTKITTIIIRSWPRPSPTGWPKPSPSFSINWSGRNGGTVRRSGFTNDDLIRERYRGFVLRPVSACPGRQRKSCFDLLASGENAGITLRKALRRCLAAAVSGSDFAHPDASTSPSAKSGKIKLKTTPAERGWTSVRSNVGSHRI